jgi:aspartate racemase
MKRIGILGGTSPESTISYYERITHEYTRRFGDYSYPEILIYSVSFQTFVDWQQAGDWQAMAAEMIEIFRILAQAGAKIGLIAANTLHRVFDAVERESTIPLLHIADAAAEVIRAKGCRIVALLGTRYTMEGTFYQNRLSQHGIASITPNDQDREIVHSVIYDELTRGIIRPESRAKFIAIIDRLAKEGAEGAVLGCTEIPLLVQDGDCSIPLFDTAAIHADAALERALK